MQFAKENPVSEAVANSTIGWLETAFRRCVVLDEWRIPHITSSTDGEAVFEWWKGSRKLTIYFSANEAEYIKVWGRDIDNQMSSGTLTTPLGFTALWLWLRS